MGEAVQRFLAERRADPRAASPYARPAEVLCGAGGPDRGDDRDRHRVHPARARGVRAVPGVHRPDVRAAGAAGPPPRPRLLLPATTPTAPTPTCTGATWTSGMPDPARRGAGGLLRLVLPGAPDPTRLARAALPVALRRHLRPRRRRAGARRAAGRVLRPGRARGAAGAGLPRPDRRRVGPLRLGGRLHDAAGAEGRGAPAHGGRQRPRVRPGLVTLEHAAAVFISLHHDTPRGRGRHRPRHHRRRGELVPRRGRRRASPRAYADSAPHRRATTVSAAVERRSRDLAHRIAARYRPIYRAADGAHGRWGGVQTRDGNPRMMSFYELLPLSRGGPGPRRGRRGRHRRWLPRPDGSHRGRRRPRHPRPPARAGAGRLMAGAPATLHEWARGRRRPGADDQRLL